MCRHTTGSLSILPNISGVNINQCNFSTTLPKKYWFNNFPGNYVLLRFLDKYCIFSNVCKYNFKKISTAPGTFCQVLDFFKEFGLTKIVLPSKKSIFLPCSYFVLLGKNSQQQQKFCYLGKAGINKNNGFKPKVRGVARNPVDHPHGGRTKSNKPEVSI
jgi:large subunit ribosomal protein L2